jgi:hypothetical protein
MYKKTFINGPVSNVRPSLATTKQKYMKGNYFKKNNWFNTKKGTLNNKNK